ncbi:MAG: dihydropteroate synthase [Bacteroidetes bacterium]|nr:dihydropteroate synthase [Bacteroidota bacterium]
MKIAAEDTFFKKKKFMRMNGKLVDFSTPGVMGILNITPDSFFDGNRYTTEKDALKQAGRMLEEGASILDIGAQSTRPGSELLSAEEEWNRLASPLDSIRKEFPSAILSIDTFYSEVAEKSISHGANLINDISGGTMDPEMFTVISRLKVPYIVMHMQGTPQNMQTNPLYENVVKEVMRYFAERIQILVSLGVNDIIIDPGFGFGKTTDHNYELLKHLDLFSILERPVMVGLSRKSMIQKVLHVPSEDALNGTTVLHTIALMKGADILRVHDVKEAMEAIKLVTCV